MSDLQLRFALARVSASMFASQAVPARLGRFVVLEQLGAGAMGQVHAAYDPELDRKVAIKLLRFPTSSIDDEDRHRLLREAKAMANVAHANVLTVFEVGEVDDREVFIAMEYAAGGTLTQWCARSKRTPAEVLEVCIDAGRGLEAAHAAGLVHRDFKPDNVLMMGDDRVRVADFGLVGVSAVGKSASMITKGRLDQTLTHRGAALGTPAYMAPELFAGEDSGPAADQFAFCVTTWQLMYGERPFRGKTIDDLEDAIRRGPGEPSKSRRGVPRPVRAILSKGLALSPGDRHESMTALLNALERTRAPKLWPRWLLAVIPLLGLGALVLPQLPRPAMTPVCSASVERLRSVWNDDRARELERAFETSGARSDEESASRIIERLHRYGESWVERHRRTCEATHKNHEQSERALDLKMHCLDDRLLALDEAVSLLTNAPDATVVDRAHAVVGELPSLDYCEDLEVLRRKTPRPQDPEDAARVDDLHATLVSARALNAAGKWEEAAQLVRSIQADAEATGYAPLRAEALFAMALIGSKVGSEGHERQREYLEHAAVLAADARDDHLAAEIWIRLLLVVGYTEGHFHEALRLGPVAEAAVARTGHDPILDAKRLNAVGIVLDELGRHGPAQDAFRRSLELRIQHYGEEHPRVAASLTNLGDSLRLGGELESSREQLLRALEIKRKTLGPHHREIAFTAQNLGAVHLALGELDEAAAMTELAIELYGGKPSEHPNVLTTLAIIDRERGEPGKAAARLHDAIEEADARWKRPQVRADAYRELALALRDLGDLEGARDAAETACAVLRGGDTAPAERAVAQTTLALLHLDLGSLTEARMAVKNAEAAWEEAESPRPGLRLRTEWVHARWLAAHGDEDAARARLQGAVDGATGQLPERDAALADARAFLESLGPSP